ncbi:hypothetical protein ACFLRY_01920 [Bacteroidota bacterium]
MSKNKHINDDIKFNSILESLKKIPILENPEQLTDSILNKIENQNDNDNARRPIQRTIMIMQRVLAAASIALLIVFGVEQYIFVDKVIQLENRNSDLEQKSQKIKGLNFLLKNIDVKKLMMAEKENKYPEKDQKFIKYKIQQARLLALNLNRSEVKNLIKERLYE